MREIYVEKGEGGSLFLFVLPSHSAEKRSDSAGGGRMGEQSHCILILNFIKYVLEILL